MSDLLSRRSARCKMVMPQPTLSAGKSSLYGFARPFSALILAAMLLACQMGFPYGQCVRQLGKAGPLYDMALSAGGSYAAIAYGMGPASVRSELAIFSTATGERVGFQETTYDSVFSVNWRRDTELDIVRWSGEALRWTPAGGFERRESNCNCDEILSPTGNIARITRNPSALEIVPVRNNGSFTVSVGTPSSRPGWSPDGTRLAYTDGGRIIVVDAAGKIMRSARRFDLPAGVTPTWLSSDHVLVGNREQGLLRLNVETNEVETLQVPGLISSSVANDRLREASISSDGRWLLITATSDHAAFLDVMLVNMVCLTEHAGR